MPNNSIKNPNITIIRNTFDDGEWLFLDKHQEGLIIDIIFEEDKYRIEWKDGAISTLSRKTVDKYFYLRGSFSMYEQFWKECGLTLEDAIQFGKEDGNGQVFEQSHDPRDEWNPCC